MINTFRSKKCWQCTFLVLDIVILRLKYSVNGEENKHKAKKNPKQILLARKTLVVRTSRFYLESAPHITILTFGLIFRLLENYSWFRMFENDYQATFILETIVFITCVFGIYVWGLAGCNVPGSNYE